MPDADGDFTVAEATAELADIRAKLTESRGVPDGAVDKVSFSGMKDVRADLEREERKWLRLLTKAKRKAGVMTPRRSRAR